MCLHHPLSYDFKLINMCACLINKNFLCTLLFITYCYNEQAANAADYPTRIGNNDSAEADTARMTIALPQGFRPQAPPFRPMLLPFATPAPSSPFGGWKPIVGAPKAPSNGYTTPTPTPLAPPPLAVLQDRMDAALQVQNLEQHEGPVLESIVYGTWKPERPLGPNEMARTTTPATAVYNRKRQPPAAYEEHGVQHPIVNTRPHITDVKLFLKNGSRRVTVTRAPAITTTTNEFIQVNMSDPNLLDMAKQINESLGGIIAHTHKPKKPNWQQQTDHTTQEVDIETETETENENAEEVERETLEVDASKVWPTDFIVSVEQRNKLHLTPDRSDNLSSDSAGPQESLNGLNIPNSLLPQISLNITKVGVPYEKQSSSEHPTICVPLTVLEQLNHVDVLEVERIYCFPLPAPTHTRHAGTPLPKEPKAVVAKVENFTEYEAVNAATILKWNYIKISCLIILNFLKLKYS